MLNNTFKIVYLIGLILASVIRGYYTFRHRSKDYKINRDTLIDSLFLRGIGLVMILPFIYIFSSWLDFADYSLPDWTGWTGTFIFICFCILLWRSHADLGKHWTATLAIRPGHRLQTKGIFSYIRHPMYAAHILWGIAQILMLHNWIVGYSFFVAVISHYLYRVGKEEQMMLDEFGEDYRKYMDSSGRIFPRIKRDQQHNQ
ncbi:MAG: isoprenylcysteine carboxylmethyltransferase family protein [Bacteroidales bacterium]|nr:MAG: isoprenylcysteine carboxylmethyltransferase family protein [Bacteroidales bacterium]